MTSDRDFGINTLAFLARAMGRENGALVQHYDARNPDFITRFGAIARTVEQSKVRSELEKLGKQSTALPHYSEILDTLVKAGGKVTVGDIGSAVVEGAEKAAQAVAFGVSTTVVVAAVLAAGYFFLIPMLLKKAKA